MKRTKLFGSKGESRTRKKREWVKNAVIAFLAVLLVLTFFSNSIMNWSLPEVAAQYPQSTTLTMKIRGSGTVAAAKTYNVAVAETRTVASVAVKAGDKISAGDVLLTLDETESQELTDARATLAALQTEYDKMLVEKGDQNNSANASLSQAGAAVSRASSDLSEAQSYESSLKWYQDRVTSAQNAVTARSQDLNDANTTLALLNNEKSTITTTNADYLAALKRCSDATAALASANAQLSGVQSQKDSADLRLSSAKTALEELTEDDPQYSTAKQEVDAAQAAWDAIMPEYNDALMAQEAAQTEQDEADEARDSLYDALTLDVDKRIAAATDSQIYAQSALDEANTNLTYAQNALSQFQSNYTGNTSVSAAQDTLHAAQDALAGQQAAAADTAQQQSYDAATAKIDQEAKAAELAQAQARVAALEEKTAASTVTARYGGVVQTVNVAAGDTTAGDSPLIVVELTDQGYTLTATVTKDQARTLREGMTAEITNQWNTDIQMTLASITTDQSSPSTARTLTFLVQGEEVTVGQQLSFSIGDKNQSFDVVVPTSAVHTDADGSFVYTVSVKSSPLGNRYSVQKTTVEVLASDDTRSAITGDISTADFVVTTSTVPLQAGDKIRIAS